MRQFITFFIFISFIAFSFGNTDNRTWRFTSGKQFEGSLLKYDDQNRIATILYTDDSTNEVNYEDLSEADRAWLDKFAALQDETIAIIKEAGGKFEKRVSKGKNYSTAYYVYYPSNYSEYKELPLWLLYHPGGQGQRFLKRHILTAERAGVIALCPDIFRNHVSDKILDPRFEELIFNVKQNIKYDHSTLIQGGSSGGAMRAYGYSAKFLPETYGIYANGGWLGRRFDLDYPAMRVAMLNGHLDKGANKYAIIDGKVLKEKQCEIKVFSFEGGHQLAPPDTQFKALIWLLEERKFYRGFSEGVKSMRSKFKYDDDKTIYSSPDAHNLAFKIFSKVDFTGTPKETILQLLGNPTSLNDFALVSEKNLDSPLVYYFADGVDTSSWIINFKEGKVSKTEQVNIGE